MGCVFDGFFRIRLQMAEQRGMYGITFWATQTNQPQILHAVKKGRQAFCGARIYSFVEEPGAFQICVRCNISFVIKNGKGIGE
jgi:hypothetical protein